MNIYVYKMSLLTFSHHAILLFILCQKNSLKVRNTLQLNLSTMATLGTEESGHCGEVAVVERLQL